MSLIPVTFKHSTDEDKKKSGKVSTVTARMLYANTFSDKVGIVKGYKKDDATDELSVAYDNTATTSTSFRLVFNKGAVSIYGGIGIVEQGTIYDIPKGLSNYSFGIKVDLKQSAGNEMGFYYKPSTEGLEQQDLQIHDTDGVYEFELFKVTTTGDVPAISEKSTQFIKSVNDFLEDKLKDLGFYEGSISLESGITANYNVLTRQGNYVLGHLYSSNGIPQVSVQAYPNASGYSISSKKLGSIAPEFCPKRDMEFGVICSIKYDSAQNTQPDVYGYATVKITVSGDIFLYLYAKNTTFTNQGYVAVYTTNDKPIMIDFGYEANKL